MRDTIARKIFDWYFPDEKNRPVWEEYPFKHNIKKLADDIHDEMPFAEFELEGVKVLPKTYVRPGCPIRNFI